MLSERYVSPVRNNTKLDLLIPSRHRVPLKMLCAALLARDVIAYRKPVRSATCRDFSFPNTATNSTLDSCHCIQNTTILHREQFSFSAIPRPGGGEPGPDDPIPSWQEVSIVQASPRFRKLVISGLLTGRGGACLTSGGGGAGADPGFWKGADPPWRTLKWVGEAEGVAGRECERGVKTPLARGGGVWGPPPENFQHFGAFSCNLGTPQPYCQAS